jgi:hypothetical protein
MIFREKKKITIRKHGRWKMEDGRWKTRDNYIQQWYKSQQEIQEKIDEIIQDQTNEQTEYTPMGEEKRDEDENN